MEVLLQHLFEDSLLSLREVLRLVLLSGLFTWVCLKAFPRNAPTRRLLLLAAVSMLTVLPWLLAGIDAVWFVRLEQLPPVTLGWLVPNVLLLLWLGVAFVLICRQLLSVRRQVAQLAAQRQITDPFVLQRLHAMASDLAIPAPTLRQGDCACSTTLGSAQLILPRHWQDWDEATLHSVLAHELVHIQRRDDRWLLLIRLLVLLYWWMPWLVWLYRIYQRAMEESCDDAASEIVGHPLAYVSALVDAAGVHQKNRFPNVAHMREHHLVGRVGRFAQTRILELDTSGVYWWVIGVLLVVMALSGIEPVLKPAPAMLPDVVCCSEPASSDSMVVYPTVLEQVDWPRSISPALPERFRRPTYPREAVYPGEAIQRQVEGDVVVEFTVTADGSVVNAAVLTSQPKGMFEASALRAVRNSRYAPAHAVPGHLMPSHIRRAGQARAETQPPAGSMRMRRYFRYRLDRR